MRELLKPNMKTLALFGCGQLAREHVAMIASTVGPGRLALRAYDTDATRLAELVALAERLGLTAHAARDPRSALEDADVVLTATTAENAHIARSDLKPEALYLAVSLLDAHLDIFLQAETILVDDLEQCLHEGRPLQILSESGQLPHGKVVEMGRWLAEGRGPPRDGLTVFNPMGTIITDLAVAKTIFDAAIAANDYVRLQI
jgi:N-[(2S)-2-amino-2-carboxyethyl]-L-glutamate dehydrogenase